MADPGVHAWLTWQRFGITRAQLRAGLQSGKFEQVSPGWYATPGADPEAVEAVRRRGALSCLSVLTRHGVWIPPTAAKLHLRGNSKAHRQHPGRYCTQFGRPQPVHTAIDDPLIALRHALRCLDAEGITVVCDSLLNISRRALSGAPVAEILTPAEVRSAFDGAPERIRACLDRCDDRAESGTETMVRLRLRSKNVRVRPQAFVPGLGRVDLLVGERLIIEVDSKRHHTGIERYREDRRRDQVAARSNLLSMRLTYENVVYDWPATEQTVLATIRQGYHRAPQQGRYQV